MYIKIYICKEFMLKLKKKMYFDVAITTLCLYRYHDNKFLSINFT